MNYDGAINAQADIFREAFGFEEVVGTRSEASALPMFAPSPGSRPLREIAVGRKKNRRDARDLVALGILPSESHNKNPDDLKLGIFIQRQELRQHRIVEEAQRLARGEAKVIYTGRVVRRAATNIARCRPLIPGGSIGHHRVTAGSIACICRHDDGGIGLLSNNHVLADTNKAALGDIILQPGRADGGRRNHTDDRIATLYQYVPIVFEAGSRNFVDAAFAVLLGGVDHNGASVVHPEDPAKSWQLGDPIEEVLGEEVHKVGRTSGHTQGQIKGVQINNLVVEMVLGTGRRLARFDNQISIIGKDRPFSASGDSGSLIFTDDGSPVALLFAGTERGGGAAGGVTFANPIRSVLDALRLEIHKGL